MVTFAVSLFSVLAMLGSTLAAPTIVERGETHNVEIINRCGAGRPVFLASGIAERGPGLITGPVDGGVAYLADYKDCQSSGVNCGTVEFSLLEPVVDPATGHRKQNGVNYSLLDGLDPIKHDSLGNHKYKYPMNYEFVGGGKACDGLKAPGQCLGQSAELCPGAFLANQPTGGKPQGCIGSNAGIRITFC